MAPAHLDTEPFSVRPIGPSRDRQLHRINLAGPDSLAAERADDACDRVVARLKLEEAHSGKSAHTGQGSLANTHMECGVSTAQGLVARGSTGEFGGESASAVVDVCVATHMRGLVPHDRMCEMRSGAVLSRRAWPLRAAPSVLSGRSSRRCAGALSSPSR